MNKLITARIKEVDKKEKYEQEKRSLKEREKKIIREAKVKQTQKVIKILKPDLNKLCNDLNIWLSIHDCYGGHYIYLGSCSKNYANLTVNTISQNIDIHFSHNSSAHLKFDYDEYLDGMDIITPIVENLPDNAFHHSSLNPIKLLINEIILIYEFITGKLRP